jgi:hypothetical protein
MSTQEPPPSADAWQPPSEWSQHRPAPWGPPTLPTPTEAQGWGPPPQPWSGPPGWTAPPSAPKPGIVALRPLGVGELLDGAIGLIRSNPRTVLGLAPTVASISAVIQSVGLMLALRALGSEAIPVSADGSVPVTEALASQLTAATAQLIPAMMAAFLQVLASGLFIVLVAAAVLGASPDAATTWRLLRPRLLPLLGLTLLLFGVGVLAVGAVVAAIAALAVVLEMWAILPGMLLAGISLALMVYCYVRFAVCSPALVIERLSPLASLRRSWRLVQGSWWRVLGILLLASVITNLLATVVTVPITGFALLVGGLQGGSTTATVLATGVATLIAGILTLPFSAAVTGLLYTDLRMRREALDIVLSTSASELHDEDPLAPYRVVPGA